MNCAFDTGRFDALLGSRRGGATARSSGTGPLCVLWIPWELGHALADAVDPREPAHPLSDRGDELCRHVLERVRTDANAQLSMLTLRLRESQRTDILICADWALSHRRLEPSERDMLGHVITWVKLGRR